jgi:CubicO group peptidase (beta-lactamase class C family)
MKIFPFAVTLTLVIALPLDISAQLGKEEIQKIDSLFISWNQPNHPGGSVGIMKQGKVVFSKAYGLASLEYLVPNTPDTRFNIASVSKQFTCMGMVLLQHLEKLSLDDDVRKFLPELPVFEDTITIRHLIHHTSGMRSLHALLGLAGWREDDSRSNKDLFRFMKNQKDLNFKPGEEYLYCNTGYMLMADIIEKITEEKFADWMHDNVFEPLGMISTYVENDYTRVVPANATSYYGSASQGFKRSVEYWGYVGSGNIHSTTNDLLVWLNNFYHPQTGWGEAFQIMQTRGILNNGDTLDYAFGININKYKGEKGISHGGSIGGFRSFIVAVPDHELNIAILSNFSSSNVTSKVNQIADILLKLDADAGPGPIADDAIPAIRLSNVEMAKFCGHYWNEQSRHSRKIYLKDDTLRYSRPESGESKLLPIGKNTFQMVNVAYVIKVSFEILTNNQKVMLVQVNDEDRVRFESYDLQEITTEVLKSYTGRYYSPELDTHYTLYVKGDSVLMGNQSRHGDFEIRIIREDDLEGELWAFKEIKVKRDKKKRILGLLVSNGRVRNLWFEKQ